MSKCLAIVGTAALLVGVAAAQEVPKFGVYLGYDYVRATSAGAIPSFNANGGGGQFIYNPNHWLGLVVDVGAVNGHANEFADFHLDNTFLNFLVGPRFTLSRHRVQPYFQVLWGGVYATSSAPIAGVPVAGFAPDGSPVLFPVDPITVRVRDSQTAFAMTAGLGLDIKVGHHVSFRPVGADYYLTRLQNRFTGDDNIQNNFRYSTGFTFLFGGEKAAPPAPQPPAMHTCPDGTSVAANVPCPMRNTSLAISASPSEICQGESVRIVPTISPAAQYSYTWTVNGQAVGQGTVYDFAGSAPGTYNIGLATKGNGFNPASAQTAITVREYMAPTGTVDASPAQINAGDKSSVSSHFTGQCGGPIGDPAYSASEGTMNGDQFDSSSIQWDTNNAGEQRKTITITAKASDSRNTGMATTTIEVVKPASAAAVRLPDILFPANNARVNNCGKRILLEQLRSYYERDSGGKVELVGHNSSDEKGANLAERRALNAAAVITAGTGVCLSVPQSQVMVSAPGADQQGVGFESGFCMSSVTPHSAATEMRRVEVWFVPTGAAIPPSVANAKAASELSVSGLGCPK